MCEWIATAHGRRDTKGSINEFRGVKDDYNKSILVLSQVGVFELGIVRGEKGAAREGVDVRASVSYGLVFGYGFESWGSILQKREAGYGRVFGDWQSRSGDERWRDIDDVWVLDAGEYSSIGRVFGWWCWEAGC